MLTRAVRRRQHLRHAIHAAERIQLPWLCPALYSSHTTYTRNNHRPIAPRTITEKCRLSANLSTNSPKLASASPVSGILDESFVYPQKPQPPPRPYELKPLSNDLSKILMLETTTTSTSDLLEFPKRQSFIAGNAWEVETTLDACLQIHRWDRAMALLSQLQSVYRNDQQELQRLYNKVLEAMVYDHIWNRSTENLSKINTWVEAVMSKADVRPNAYTFALKIKAAMATLQGTKRDRTVRRYWDMAKEYNVDWEVASLRGILSDSDLGKLSEISPLQLGSEEADFDVEEGNDITAQDDVISQPAVPQVLETAQRGLGMVSLKKSLSLFSTNNHLSEWESIKQDDPEARTMYARRRQLQLERDSLASATERWRMEHEKMLKMGVAGTAGHGQVGALIWTWHQHLTKKIQAELVEIEQAELKAKRSEHDKLRCEYGPFLRLLDPQHLAALTTTAVVAILNKSGMESRVRLVRLVVDLGKTIEAEIHSEAKARHSKMKDKARQKYNLDDQNAAARSEVLRSELPPRQRWSNVQYGKVGSVLCEMLFDVAKIKVTQNTPSGEVSIPQAVFMRQSMYVGGKSLAVVSLHPDMVSMLTKEPVADLIAKQLPMVCEPAPWKGFEEGGYLESRSTAVRIKAQDHTQREYSKAAADRGDLDQMFAALDVLGQTGWRINKNVFQVMVEAWNSGEAVANLPPLEKVFPEIVDPGEGATAREKFNYYRSLQSRRNEEGGLHSNRCFQNFQLEIARAYLNETFYLPHNVDFRGRAYPVPPHLNQMGADNARALLTFEKGRKLGERGLRWLKIQLANVCGYDKASLMDRAKYADEHMDDVRDAVQNPLNGNRWWLSAEDPWQCLAVCHELVQAIDSGNPHDFVSHLPVHQDGTCNGLQHYAALGGDIAGARQVNLEPGDKPADVYTGVAELVKAEIKRDAEAGDELAKVLEGKITRKIVKQTVMTNVYGVTFNGAINQVRKQLDALYPDLVRKKLNNPAATYIARKIFKGLGTLFEGAHDIQYWFGDCATRITNSISLAQLEEIEQHQGNAGGKTTTTYDRRSKRDPPMYVRATVEQSDFRSTVVWTTPLKLPVVQPYRISRTQTIKTHMANMVLTEPAVTDCIDKRKQLQAFPPNFIHSLDATHMMLSALEAQEKGMSFSAVHDSFWTHAADIDDLNILLRDAFVRMHAENIVGRLAAEFETRYKGHIYLTKVADGSILAQKLAAYRESTKQSDHETSSIKVGKKANAMKRRQFWELMQEHKRQKLLNSADPAEQAKGRGMVTAASIFEKHGGEKYLENKTSLGETALGHIVESQHDPETAAIDEALSHDEIAEVHDVDLEASLEPLIDAKADSASSLSAPTETDSHETLSASPIFAARSRKNVKKEGQKGRKGPGSTWLWLPLTFKSVPKKGDWDVRRLKESTYFFS